MIAGAFGLGGGTGLLRLFTTQSAHAEKLRALEEERKGHDTKIEETHTTVTELNVRMDTVEGNTTEILKLMREKD